MSDIAEKTDLLQIEGILLTVDIGKAFDSVNHWYLLLKSVGLKTIIVKNR